MNAPVDTLTGIAGRLRRGETSAVAVLEDCLSRIEARQPQLNAFLYLDREGALGAAWAADRALASGKAVGPLCGVPLAHKDMFDRIGRAPSCGSQVPADRVPEADAECLRRLDAAGALNLGGLNMSEFACNGWGYNDLAGPARNPHGVDHVAGGSSSGSAAAVAAGLVYGSLGSDTGGSVRLPASWCGCVGLLPTRGLVPLAGAMKTSPSLDAIGPIARTAMDCATLLGAVADGGVDYAMSAQHPLGRCSVGLPALTDLDPAIRQAMDDAVDRLDALGVECRPMLPLDLDRITAQANIVLLSELCATHLEMLRTHGASYTPWVRDRMLTGIGIAATDYIAALSQRGRALEAFCATAFADADVLLLPVAPYLAPTLAAVQATIAGTGPALPDVGTYTRSTNYLGLPALALPCGTNEDGLPTAVQFVGRPFSEALLLRLGHCFERVRHCSGSAGSRAEYHT